MEPAGRRERVFRRDRYRCVYCGEEHSPAELTLDHVEPRMRGGDQSEGNLVTSCTRCNREKGSAPAWRFLRDRPDLRATFMAAVAGADVRWARPVWPRLVRAIEEAIRG
jgi:5-methylcytosine-specific restriction endonuclease McrA